MLGLLGLRIFEATGADIADLGEEHGHRVLRVCGKGTKVVLVPLPPAVGRATDRAVGDRVSGPVLLNRRGARMDRHAATRRLRRPAEAAGVPITRPHPHMLRHLGHDQFRCRRGLAGRPDRSPARRPAHHDALRPSPKNLDRHPNYSWPPTWPPAPNRACGSHGPGPARRSALPNTGRARVPGQVAHTEGRLWCANGATVEDAARPLWRPAGLARTQAERAPNHDPPEGSGPSLRDDSSRWDPHRFGSPSPRSLGGVVRGARPSPVRISSA